MPYPLDFSKPWQFSDVVLVVEEDRFHVHRNILGIWSEVFTTMFTSGFKEKYSGEVPLPGKKSSEIKEMLLVIYPTSAKPINQENYAFLLDLAKEYMMRNLTGKCGKFLMNVIENLPHGLIRSRHHTLYTDKFKLDCLDLLDIAQNYGLYSLKKTCIEKAKGLSLGHLRGHQMYSRRKIPFDTLQAILEGRIEMLENKAQNCGNCRQQVFPEHIIDILDIIEKEIVLIKFYFSRFSLISFLDTAFFLL